MALLHLLQFEIHTIELYKIFVNSNNFRDCNTKFRLWVALMLTIWHTVFFVDSMVSGSMHVRLSHFSLLFEVGIIMCVWLCNFSLMFKVSGAS